MNEGKTITVFLADDHPLTRIGLGLILEQSSRIKLIGEAADGYKAVEKIKANPPDVALLDIDMPGLSGIGAIRVLRKSLPELNIIVLSTYSDEEYVREAMQAGANGYVVKNTEIEELIKIIEAFAEGRPSVSPYLLDLAVDWKTSGRESSELDGLSLTKRERQILRYLAEGKTNKAVASLLFISAETVKTHVKSIFSKLEVSNRLEAVAVAREKGFVD